MPCIAVTKPEICHFRLQFFETAFALSTPGFLVMDCSAQIRFRWIRHQRETGRTADVNWFMAHMSLRTFRSCRLTGSASRSCTANIHDAGRYIKAIFAIHDQISGQQPGVGDDFQGFAKRLANRQVGFIIPEFDYFFGQRRSGGNPAIAAANAVAFWPAHSSCDCQKLCDLRSNRAISTATDHAVSVGAASSRAPGDWQSQMAGTRVPGSNPRNFLLGQA